MGEAVTYDDFVDNFSTYAIYVGVMLNQSDSGQCFSLSLHA